jgi:hypothetical protein
VKAQASSLPKRTPGPVRRTSAGRGTEGLRLLSGRTLPQCAAWFLSAGRSYPFRGNDAGRALREILRDAHPVGGPLGGARGSCSRLAPGPLRGRVDDVNRNPPLHPVTRCGKKSAVGGDEVNP